MKLLKNILFGPAVEKFEPGQKVNLVTWGQIPRTDGVVIAQRSREVLVEWHRGGSSYEKAQDLYRIEA